MSITTSHDKNNPHLEHMERVVYCCCDVTNWTCLVHEAKALFENNPLRPDDALVQCESGDMYYRAMLKIVKDLVEKIGCDPSNYGTHSARSGGTTEQFLIGKEAVWIQNFGWWNNIGSVLIYIRPNNPDLLKFVSSTVEYMELRASEGQKLDAHESKLQELQLAVNAQNRKKRKGNRANRAFAKVTRVVNNDWGVVKQATYSSNDNSNKHVYTDYTEHTYYQTATGKWCFNPYAKARAVPTMVSSLNVFVRARLHTQLGPIAPVPILPVVGNEASVNDSSIGNTKKVVGNDKAEIE